MVTPLRKAVGEECGVRSLWKLMGVLEERREINKLLSAQVESNNHFNAKCNDGISHLHIACMFNHLEAVQLLAKSGESLNQAINADANILPGYTPLHCAIRYSSSEAAIILLALGADIYLENAEGISPINYLIERLLDVHDYLIMSTVSHCTRYEREIERLDTILKTIVLKYKLNDSILIENTGLSALHLACTLKDNWIIQHYYLIYDRIKDLNKPVTCKSKVWSGWTPLHFAICCNMQTFKLLWHKEEDIKIKNAKGQTAFDFCLQRYSPEIAFSFLSTTFNVACNKDDKLSNKSDLILGISKYNTCQQFIEKLPNINIIISPESSIWPGYNLLHMAISMNHKIKYPQVFRDRTDQDRFKIGYCVSIPDNSTTENQSFYWHRIEVILKKGCSIYAKNKDGLTPIHLAFKLDKWYIVEELLARAQHNVIGPGNLSFLHIACAMGKKDVVERLLEKGADVNSPLTSSFEFFEKPKTLADVSNLRKILIRKNSSPLHIAVKFVMEEVIETLLKKNPDVHTQDEFGSTPIHLSLAASRSITELLLSNVTNLKDVKRADGLSHLHVAAIVDDEKAAKKLIQDGADINQTYFGKTSLHLAMKGQKAARVLLEMGADVCVEDQENETPLDLAMKNSNSSTSQFLFQKLKNNELKISASMSSGLTPLHIACATFDLDWAKNLLKTGANPNAKMTNSDEQINTPLHLVIAKAVSAGPVTEKLMTFIKLLLQYGADLTLVNEDSTTPLHMIASAYVKQFGSTSRDSQTARAILLATANMILSCQRSLKINSTNSNGFSHFHCACIINNLVIIKKYLYYGVDVNHAISTDATEYAGFTSLHFACKQMNLETIRLLLQQGGDVNAADAYGDTPLHILVQSNSIYAELFDTFLTKGADINAKNLKNETPFTSILRRSIITNELLHFFMIRKSLIDINKKIDDGQGIIGYIMERSKPSDIELVFETLINFCNIKKAISEGFLAIHNAVCVKKSKNLTREHYLKTIKRLTDIGSNIDEQDEKGKRPLDKALQFCNIGAVEALLLLGANIDVIEINDQLSVTRSFPNNYNYIGERQEANTIMENHLWKMMMVKLDLTASSQNAAIKGKPDDNIVHDFHLELEKLQKRRICQSVTAGHFLSEWRAVIDYPTLSIVERQAIDNFFKQSANLHKEFPKFAGLLMMQYRKAVARVKLMQPAKNILVEAGIDLPDLCLEAILQYFKNYELTFWIEEADEMFHPHKRQRVQ